MPITHKFQDFDWYNGFRTENSILLNDDYAPEVLIIGSFNQGWDWNPADFFYGRGMYMWTIMANLFVHNGNILFGQVAPNNGLVPLNQIFEICQRGRISFADIVKGTAMGVNTVLQPNNSILVNGYYHWTNHSDNHLNYMGAHGWLYDNVESICKYINQAKSIKHVYFTFKSAPPRWLWQKMNSLIACINKSRPDVTTGSIFTPSGQGFGENLPFYPGRAASLAHCWVWNGANPPHLDHPIIRAGYTHFDHDWLISKGVTPNNF